MRQSISTFDAVAFKAWLRDQGAVILDPKNEYEACRYRFGRSKVNLIYSQPSKRRWTLCGPSIEHHRAYMAGEPIPTMEAVEGAKLISSDFDLYSDASHYHLSRAGAWAAILLAPADRIGEEACGALRGDVTSSAAAEMMAVANALHHFLKARSIPIGATIRVICDNTTVVSYIGRGGMRIKSKSPDLKLALAHIIDLAKRYRLKLIAEWVRGHQRLDSKDPRAIFNRRCDKLASGHAKALDQERKANAA